MVKNECAIALHSCFCIRSLDRTWKGISAAMAWSVLIGVVFVQPVIFLSDWLIIVFMVLSQLLTTRKIWKSLKASGMCSYLTLKYSSIHLQTRQMLLIVPVFMRVVRTSRGK